MDFVEEQAASAVLLGNFNPAIFNPDWLAREGIIGGQEAEDSRIDVIHPELSRFEVSGLVFDINSERFAVHARMEPFVRLADIIADVFGDRLSHTPLTALGLNYAAHFQVRDWKQQSALGRLLAPIEPWGEWGQKLKGDSPRSSGGLANLTMLQQRPDERVGGAIQISIQPSKKIEAGKGVFFQFNDHFDGGEEDKLINYPQLCVDKIEGSFSNARQILNSIVETARSL